MKHLHKFFSKQDLSWVKIIWDRYYKNDKLPRKTNRVPFGGRGSPSYGTFLRV
jgi:hypothetical protein